METFNHHSELVVHRNEPLSSVCVRATSPVSSLNSRNYICFACQAQRLMDTDSNATVKFERLPRYLHHATTNHATGGC